MTTPKRVRGRGLMAAVSAVALVGSLLFVAWPSALEAQDCYPAGCPTSSTVPGETTTTVPGGNAPTCGLSLSSGEARAQVTATVQNVPAGRTVRILFDGTEVGRGTAPVTAQSVGAPVLFGGQALPAQAAPAVTVSFTVPDVPPGHYTVAAVGDTFTVACGTGSGQGFEVLGASIGRPGDNDGNKIGPMPKTGAYILGMVIVAIILLVAGRFALSLSRRREAHARNHRPRVGV